jgi:hypothetical protein
MVRIAAGEMEGKTSKICTFGKERKMKIPKWP